MAISNIFSKDPHATLDFGFDWSQWLAENESIDAFTITISPCGLINTYDTNTAGSVIVWLSSGSVGQRYDVACLIETSASRIDERTIKIDCRNR